MIPRPVTSPQVTARPDGRALPLRGKVAGRGMTCFVEFLTLRTWCQSVLPRLMRAGKGRASVRCYVFDASPLGLAVARASRWLTGATVEPLHFRLADVRDEHGLFVWFRVSYRDLAEVQAQAMEEAMFQEALASLPDAGRLRTYLANAMASTDLGDRQTLWRALLAIQVCAWKMRLDDPAIGPPLVRLRSASPLEAAGGPSAVLQRTGGRDVAPHRGARDGATGLPVGLHEQSSTSSRREPTALYFLERRPWLSVIRRYARPWGVEVVPIHPTRRPRTWIRERLPSGLLERLRDVRSQSLHLLQRFRHRGTVQKPMPVAAWRSPSAEKVGSRIAVEYYGQLNLENPERYSDLFFWQASSLPASALLVLFGLPIDPLDQEKWLELTERGIAALAVHPRATTVPEAPVFLPHHSRRDARGSFRWLAGLSGGLDAGWLKEHLSAYLRQRWYWTELFASQNVKLYVSWFKNTETHCAIADALQSLGGVTAIYHRSYEASPSAEATVAADVVFGFSPAWAEIERQSGSVIPYYITTGYLGDHRFPQVRSRAQAIRDALHRQGAKRIVAYCDENSSDEERWTPGHVMTREHYAFLLEKVLAEPWLGLVIKPKVPRTLRRRLGPVAALLEQAEATGRCLLLDGGRIHGAFAPVVAALAADLMIHGHLCAATAGVESALAGVPTLLMDREGWPLSPFYRLGVGRVVFHEWDALWRACRDHWRAPEGVSGFGDWSGLLNDLDPFRDGRAAQRMGTYLQWLREGFEAGRSRDTVMAGAAERYAARWGKDKVLQVHPALKGGMNVGRREERRMPPGAEACLPEEAMLS